MIELIIDYATNKITGYNTILPQDADGLVLADDGEIAKLLNVSPYDRLYYVDGKITEQEPDDYYKAMKELDSLYFKLQKKTIDEHRIFMDNVISGMPIEKAASVASENRKAFQEISKKREALIEEHGQKEKTALLNRFEQEEAAIRYPYFLSMVAVVRNENDYLEEWIRYHVEELGFDHFYIYDNESDVPAETYLKSKNFRHLDKVTFVPFQTTENVQQDSHNDFLKKFGKETKWFLPADPDEYVIVKERGKTLKEFLAENSRYAIIECVWHHFNANGHEKKTAGTDMERFTKEADWHYGKYRGKRFAQSNRVRNMVNHVPQPRTHAEINSNPQEEFFQLNHYYTRSYEEWLEKMKRGTAVPYARRKYSEFFELNPDMKYLDAGKDYAQGYGPPDQSKGSQSENI